MDEDESMSREVDGDGLIVWYLIVSKSSSSATTRSEEV